MIKTIKVLAGATNASRKLAKDVESTIAKDFELVEQGPDLYLVVGGDGTLLHWLRDLDYPVTPFLGINGGNLGYFQEIELNELPQTVKNLKDGSYAKQKFPLLELKADGELVARAFNEFAVERASARALNLAISIDSYKFEKYIGDGLIISSPQGSTAYGAASGGAILPYDLNVFELVPSNPHQSALYKALRQPLVLSDKTRVQVEVLDSTNRPIRVVADGHEVTVKDRFEFGMSQKFITMLRTHNFNFYERLSLKLIG